MNGMDPGIIVLTATKSQVGLQSVNAQPLAIMLRMYYSLMENRHVSYFIVEKELCFDLVI